MATLASPSRLPPTTLRELLQRLPDVLSSQTPAALPLEPCATTEALEALACAEARFLKSADSFFRPCFQGSVLENLTRDDPVAPPNFDNEAPDTTAEKALGRRRVDEATDRLHADQTLLRASAGRVEEQAAHMRERLAELARKADAASDAGLSVLDTAYSDGDTEESRESDRKSKETLRELAEIIEAAEARKAALEAQATALREDLNMQEREVAALENAQAVAVASAAADASRRAEASRETEALVGATEMTEAQLDAAVAEEEALVQRNIGIGRWYRATVANMEQIGGVRASYRLLFGMAEGGSVAGLEVMVELGSSQSSQVMEVTVSCADGSLRSAQLCPSRESGGMAEGGITPWELEELLRAADALPAPENLRMLVIEALSCSKCAALRNEHVRLMRRRYLVDYRAATREVTITMPVGIVALFRLHPDYPRVAGGAEVVTLTGVGGWSTNETEKMCRQVNDLALATLMDTMDRIEAAVTALDRSGM